MKTCACESPSEHPNPRFKGKCVKCEGSLPERLTKPLMLRCARCYHGFDASNGRVGIFFTSGGSAADELRDSHVKHLCPNCGDSLGAWIGIRPDELWEAA